MSSPNMRWALPVAFKNSLATPPLPSPSPHHLCSALIMAGRLEAPDSHTAHHCLPPVGPAWRATCIHCSILPIQPKDPTRTSKPWQTTGNGSGLNRSDYILSISLPSLETSERLYQISAPWTTRTSHSTCICTEQTRLVRTVPVCSSLIVLVDVSHLWISNGSLSTLRSIISHIPTGRTKKIFLVALEQDWN